MVTLGVGISTDITMKPRYNKGDEVAGITIVEYFGRHMTCEKIQHMYLVKCACEELFTTHQKKLVIKWGNQEELSCKQCTNKKRGQGSNNWTEHELHLLKTRYSKFSVKELTQFLDRSESAILHMIQRLKLTK